METDSDNESGDVCGSTTSTRGVKRKIRRSSWKKENAQKKRNSGKSYISRSGKRIPAKRFSVVKTCCKLNCAEARMKTFQQALKMGAVATTENRGKHTNRPRKIDQEIWDMTKKNPSSVCSFLYDFLTHKLEVLHNVKSVILFSDSCGGQNKNITVVNFCAWLSKSLNLNISHIFPVRGHSYNQNDRNFGMYGQVLKRVQTIEHPSQYLNIMTECCTKPSSFSAVMSSDIIED
ncbi:hypothetical protein ANN_13804 [Periplaneta americana]|uniref:DUF7869 domain-containing protein n=1 Tax=Periplaneta americana TaxID=6978 RepID=A0ABQ8SWP2_PERAM|nr:hypothetical protein ANN_13804 [Periplaneta americana]